MSEAFKIIPGVEEFKEVTREEFEKFLAGNSHLTKHGYSISDPPVVYYKDGDKCVAREWLLKGWPKPNWTAKNNSLHTESSYELKINVCV